MKWVRFTGQFCGRGEVRSTERSFYEAFVQRGTTVYAIQIYNRIPHKLFISFVSDVHFSRNCPGEKGLKTITGMPSGPLDLVTVKT